MNILQKTIADALSHSAAQTRAARRARRCAYVKINGIRCGSPALHRDRLCYFHHRMRLPRPAGAPFPPLEDEASIQYALMTVLDELRRGKLDHRTAGLLLYGLQTASFNIRRARFEPYAPNVVRTDPGDLLGGTVIPQIHACAEEAVSYQQSAKGREPRAHGLLAHDARRTTHDGRRLPPSFTIATPIVRRPKRERRSG